MLVAIDDVQWLDAATAAALSFALRRVGDHRIALLVAQRTSAGERGELRRSPLRSPRPRSSELRRSPWTPRIISSSPGTVARSASGVAADARGVWRQSVLRARARPFPRAPRLVAGSRRGAPGPATLRGLVDETLDELGEGTRRLVARVAALFDPTLAVVAKVAQAASLDGELDAALDAGVLELRAADVRFSHPLLAAAAYDQIGTGRAPTPPSRARRVGAAGRGARAPPGAGGGRRGWPTAAVLEREAAAVRARGACAPRLSSPSMRSASHPRKTTRPAPPALLGGLLMFRPATIRRRRRSSDVWPPLPRGPERARAISSLAWPDLESRGLAECARLHEEALFEAAADPVTSALASLRLSTLERILGDMEAARRYAVRA